MYLLNINTTPDMLSFDRPKRRCKESLSYISYIEPSYVNATMEKDLMQKVYISMLDSTRTRMHWASQSGATFKSRRV